MRVEQCRDLRGVVRPATPLRSPPRSKTHRKGWHSDPPSSVAVPRPVPEPPGFCQRMAIDLWCVAQRVPKDLRSSRREAHWERYVSELNCTSRRCCFHENFFEYNSKYNYQMNSTNLISCVHKKYSIISIRKYFTCFNEENYIISCTISLNSSYITINTIDGKKFSKLSNGFRKLPKFNITQSIMSISYKKVYEVKPQFERHSES